ncbi:RNA ligase [Halobiforma lacisalsi AJ5]|uniref:ATP dependent DNA ligase n=1 Tax=Natronobacterium lacisalsi AJ5 TaxID=358396 RepID=M0L4W5_NATLA|nr:RNA ligase [Halobiforma lacisalsi]APW98166.1 RNA ligase [Halobiforma lacisalsi AJ5]EMA28148.1 ATP dependent DNA ligase [Halobiforma lacisalsi AJ5]
MADGNRPADGAPPDPDALLAEGYHRRLGIGESAFRQLAEYLERREYEGRPYWHVSDYRRGIERGTVLIGGTVVRGFPKVPRTLVLETGVPEGFPDHDAVAVEEKLNGYNVRVARIGSDDGDDGDLLAFTRSGLICPFTTRVLERLVELEPLFDAFPDAMVCGEMIGPENPYTAHEYADVDSLAFRAFDWRDRESGDPLPVRERRERYERFDVPQTRLFGIYDVAESGRSPTTDGSGREDGGDSPKGKPTAADEVRRIIERLDERGREGVVMKSLDGREQLKYTTSAANVGDLAYAFSLPFDYGQAFMFRRLIREAFQSVEWDESDEEARERTHDLGEAILLSMRDTIETVAEGESVGERHTVRASPEAVDALLEHLRGQGLRIEIESDEREDGDRVVTFCKRTQSTNDKTKNYLEGQVVRE